MKKLFTLVFFLSVLHSFAQTSYFPDEVTSDTLQSLPASAEFQETALPDTIQKDVFRKNIVKINLSSLALENYSLSYERSLTRKITFVAGYSFMPKTEVASVFLVEKVTDKFMDEDDETIEYMNLATVASNSLTGEVRFYTGKHPGARGFYLSLYGRYMNAKAAYLYDYEAYDQTYTLPFDGTIKGFGGGLMIGAQWLIAKRVTFDWYILGAHYGKTQVSMPVLADLSLMTSEDKDALKEEIESINDHLNGKASLEATVSDRGVNLKGDAPFAGIRGLGFTLGVAF
ncbi:DUF3575 domain-containing protein [Pontibacter silvestris]|uniref:DUF3575 domain-containing protein n=1 Tax=Pontibacter silvestris TaxID=2305183 RepID=A0ABW4WSG8_9BACT|nr:DUF3575 domain-containing protein [Pontibacter silvestris]MCC9138197.1 DUF3575 domain-containing protein [Pontibacter silvestris]